MLEHEAVPPSRALICGTAKTIHRYRSAVEGHGFEVRALEVLCFQPDAAALKRAALRVLEAQQQAQAPGGALPLQVVLTSSAAVRMLQETIDELRAGSVHATELGHGEGPGSVVLTIRGCGTEAACRSSSSFNNVLFCGERLCDVYNFLRSRTTAPTLLLGVRSGGDRSYRSDPVLRTAIDFIGLYDTCVAPGARAAVNAALGWAGATRCHVVVTSSKSAALLAQVVATGPPRREIVFVAQGESTAAALRVCLAKFLDFQ